MIQNGKLEVFENFIVDRNLKRKNSNKLSNTVDSLNDSGLFMDSEMSMSIGSSDITWTENTRIVEYLEYVYSHNRTLINWIKLKFAKSFLKEKTVNKIKYKSVDQFFKDIKGVVKELKLENKSLDFYTKAIETAEENGQKALVEILYSKKEEIVTEIALIKAGITKYVNEEDVVKFFEKSKLPKKVLKLTWIKNYARIIPQDVLQEKKIFDEKGLFDNYVVLHFDKNDDGSQMTQEEKERAKDPILFGVCKYSRKLFYVADWIDEYCDLTLDKFLETIEMENARELNKEEVEEILKR
jgi:hypothetical protein